MVARYERKPISIDPVNGAYRPFYELASHHFTELSYQRGERKFRFEWEKPPAQLPFAVLFWASWDIDPATIDTETDHRRVGQLFIKWADNAGQLIVQQFPLFVRTPASQPNPVWTFGCTNFQRSTKNQFPWEPCLNRTNKLRLPYEKVAWGCAGVCYQTTSFPWRPMEWSEDRQALEIWYDKLLQIKRPALGEADDTKIIDPIIKPPIPKRKRGRPRKHPL
jgi:hypothetical protein